MMMRSALYQNNMLSWILQCQITKTTVRGQTCRLTRTHYPDSEPTSLCSFSLMLRAYKRSKNINLYSLWYDPTGARTHDAALEASTLTITPPMRFVLYEAAWTRPRHTFMTLRGRPFNLGCFFLKKKYINYVVKF